MNQFKITTIPTRILEDFESNNELEEELFNDTQINEEIEKPKEDNIFINGLKWIKDFIVSIPAKLISTGYSITRVAQEGNAERQEMLDNMTDEEINSLDNKNKTLQNFVMGNSLSKTFDQTTSVGQMKDTRTKLYIKDTIQDTARDFGNGIISIANNILNFFSFGNLGKNTIPEIKDFSVLQNSEQYGNYKSKEELTKAIQEDVNNAYKQIGIYNPSANKWGGVTADIIATIALGNAGMSNTASIVSVSGVSSLGETGSVEESTKSVVTSYLFSKIVDSKTLNKIVKEPTSRNN